MIGDSTVYGDQAGGPAQAWPAALGLLRGWTVTNAGINGSELVRGGSAGATPMVDRWQAVVPAGFAGHVLVLGGTNDYNTSRPLGRPGGSDPNTIHGALLTMARELLGRGPLMLHLLTPLWRGDAGRTEGTRNAAGYTLEQVRQAVRDTAAQLSQEFPGRVQLIDVGTSLRDWLSSAPYINADLLHPTGVGHVLIAQHLHVQVLGTDQATAPLYSREFGSLAPGLLDGQDSWTVYGGSYTVSGSGLSLAANFASQARGALRAVPGAASRAVMTYDPASIAAAGDGLILRGAHRLSDDASLCAWVIRGEEGIRLDWGTIAGTQVQSWAGIEGYALPDAGDTRVEIALAPGGMVEVRAWPVSGSRPATPMYTHTDPGIPLGVVGLVGIGAGPRTVRGVQVQ
ncbi:SGNH/GDSL hydrolase family protein [Deinococcus arenae]|nr:SGNH/GDSL hydrolase family protein [Deinococcus arenae]